MVVCCFVLINLVLLIFTPHPAQSGYYAKQFCCYYCEALAWTYSDQPIESCNFLYTNFGRQSSHRQTLVTVEKWRQVNPQTPLTNIPGWSPWRSLSVIVCCNPFSRFLFYSIKNYYSNLCGVELSILLRAMVAMRNLPRPDASGPPRFGSGLHCVLPS